MMTMAGFLCGPGGGALRARTQPAQVFEAEDSRVMAVRPDELDGVPTHRLDVVQLRYGRCFRVTEDAEGIGWGLATRPAARARALMTEESQRQPAVMAIAPLDLQRALREGGVPDFGPRFAHLTASCSGFWTRPRRRRAA